jgi:Flp pilus assembly protein protease CpaA
MFDPLSNILLITIMLAILGIAVLSDTQERRIPNQLVVVGLLLGLIGQTWLAGGGGPTVAASGALVGLLCLLPFYIAGGMGAGDVKLMAMCGAFLGPLHVVVASVATLLVGGVIGIASRMMDSRHQSRPLATKPNRHQLFRTRWQFSRGTLLRSRQCPWFCLL